MLIEFNRLSGFGCSVEQPVLFCVCMNLGRLFPFISFLQKFTHLFYPFLSFRNNEVTAHESTAGDGLIPFVFRAIRVVVEKRRKTMSADPIPNNVVLFATIEFPEIEVWFSPVNSVFTYRDTRDFTMGDDFTFCVVM